MAYDPQKAHEYYERTKQLKGRKSGRNDDHKPRVGRPKPPRPTISRATQGASAKVVRLQAKVSKLQNALSEAQAALSKKRQGSRKESKKDSDGKSTAKEKQASKEYREKNRSKIAEKRKREGSSDGGSSKSSSTSVSSMGVEALEARISKIKSALTEAKRQLSNARSQHGQLAHSDLASDPMANEHFARFRSAERIPSK